MEESAFLRGVLVRTYTHGAYRSRHSHKPPASCSPDLFPKTISDNLQFLSTNVSLSCSSYSVVCRALRIGLILRSQSLIFICPRRETGSNVADEYRNG